MSLNPRLWTLGESKLQFSLNNETEERPRSPPARNLTKDERLYEASDPIPTKESAQKRISQVCLQITFIQRA
ncbi:uncharacterized protein LOC113658156, partial [Tachysurus ichikawai]